MRGPSDLVKNLLFIFSAVLLLILVVFLNQEVSHWLLRHVYYWILLVVFVLWLSAMFRYIGDQPKRFAFRKKEWLYLIVCALWLLFMQDSGYKLGMEEAELVASSRQMHLEKEYGVAQRGYDLGGAYYDYDIDVDTRPGFFPFLLSLLHDFTGYRSGQGFVLNAFLAGFLVYMFALIGRRLWPASGIWAGPLLALSIPFIPFLANSSSADLLNGVMLLVVIYLILDYWKSRNSLILWPVVWSLILFANTSYDSLLCAIFGGVVLWQLQKRSGQTPLPATAALLPWALLPLGLLLKLSISADEPLPQEASAGLWTNHGYARISTAADTLNRLKTLAQLYKGQNVLFIVEQPPVVIVEEISAISMARAISHKAELALHLELGTFSAIYVIQDDGSAFEGDADFILEPVKTPPPQADLGLQLSELVQVNASPAERARLIEQLDGRDLSMEWFEVMPEILP